MRQNLYAKICVGLFLALTVKPVVGASLISEGYYPLTAAFGSYQRLDNFSTHYDGLPQAETTIISLDDSAINGGTDEGYIVILPNGQVTGHWVQRLNFTATWSGVHSARSLYSGIITPEARLDVDVTGTVIAETATEVTLQLEALIDCAYFLDGSFGQSGSSGSDSSGNELARFGTAPVSWSAVDVPVSMTVTAQRSEDGGLSFSIPTTQMILPAIAAASPAAPSPEGVSIGNFAWPETSQPYLNSDGNVSQIPGLAVTAGAAINIGAWRFGPTYFQFAAPFTGVKPVFEEYYLLDVPAPFGFVATSTQGNLPGEQTVRFQYGDQVLVQSIESGRAFAPFDYGDAPTTIESAVMDGASVLESVSRPLQKLPVPPWAEPVSAWSAAAGIRYSSTLDWPLSLATSRTLNNASILSGLWGITGAADSEMLVNADSLGTPTRGTLEGRVRFKAAGKEIGFTLGGTHQATLNASGLSLTGACETSNLSLPLLQASITPLSLIPGLQGAVSAHPFFARIIRGTGVGLRSQLSLSAGGGYAAGPSDLNLNFTSGSITGAVDVSARLNVLPEMMRDILYLGIEGGGGLETTIQLAPTVDMTSLGGRLYFTGVASFFGLEATGTEEFTFGDFAAPAPVAARKVPPVDATKAAEVTAVQMADAPVSEILPARANIAAAFAGSFSAAGQAVAVASVPSGGGQPDHSFITIRSLAQGGSDLSSLQWVTQSVGGAGANLAPTIGFNRLPNSEGRRALGAYAIVWSHSTTPTPTTAAERETFANGMELSVRELVTTFNEPWGGQLTNNSLCDFGASIPQSAGHEGVRVFWGRSQGTDFTGATTPITLHTRRWIHYADTEDEDIDGCGA